MKTLIALLIVIVSSGCASYTHKRPVLLGVTNGVPVIAYEETHGSVFAKSASASGVKGSIKQGTDGSYSRTVSLDEASGTESEIWARMIEAAFQAGKASAK